MAIVTTGQITIVDNNDARPITAYITATPGTQQVFSKDESTVSYTPDWRTGASLVLTAKVFAGASGSAEDVTGLLSNRRWSLDLSTAITGSNALISSNAQLSALFTTGTGHTFTTVHNASGSTLTISANLLPDLPLPTIYFEGDYTDPVTGLVSKVVAQIGLNVVKTGTNAVYVMMIGQTAIEAATGGTKNVAAVTARLVRAAGIDNSGITYRWFENNGGTEINNVEPFLSKYGLKTTNLASMPTGNLGNIGSNLTAAGVWGTHNTLVIHESAVQDMGIYRVEAKDADGTIYQTYFTIYDVSDPYDLKVLSSAGEKLQNGVGSTQLTPEVYYGATRVTDLTGWKFKWTFFNKDGKRGAFVDRAVVPTAGGRGITGNTATVFTYDGAAISFPTPIAGNILKCVTPGGAEFFYEVASATGNTVTVRAPTTHASWLTTTNFPMPTANQFQGGKLFVCQGATTQGQVTTTSTGTVESISLTITGDDIDAKGRIVCEGDRP